MTKTEFKSEAAKAGIPAELYGVVLKGQLPTTSFIQVCGGKVVGIEWRDEWQTREEYSYWVGTHKVTSLGKAPYVVLSKNRQKYFVEAWRVKGYIDKRFHEWLNEKVKSEKIL